MSETDYRDALRLLNSTLVVVEERHAGRPSELRRRLRALSLEVDLLRARIQQPPAHLRRN